MSAHRRRLVEAQDAFPIAEAHPSVHLAPVAVVAPFPALAGVAVPGPARQLVIEHVVEDLKVALGHAVLEVVGPALNDRVERVDQSCLRCASMLVDHLSKIGVAWRPLPAGLTGDLCRPSPGLFRFRANGSHHLNEADRLPRRFFKLSRLWWSLLAKAPGLARRRLISHPLGRCVGVAPVSKFK